MTVHPLVRAGYHAPPPWNTVWLTDEAARYALAALYPTLQFVSWGSAGHHGVCAADDRPPPTPPAPATHPARLLGRPCGLRTRATPLVLLDVGGFVHLLGESRPEHPRDPERYR